MRRARFMVALVVALVVLITAMPVGLAGKSVMPEAQKPAAKPVVTVMVVNNAKTTFDADLTERITGHITGRLAGYYGFVPGETSLVRLARAGIEDVAAADSRDVARVLRGMGVDCAVYVELAPFVRKEKWTVFTHGMEMTAVLPVKIIGAKSGRSLYTGKVVEKAAGGTFVLLGLGNKPVAEEAVDQALVKLDRVMAEFLPLQP